MFEQIARIEQLVRDNAPHWRGALDDVVIAWQRIALAAERIADAIAPAPDNDGEVIELHATEEHDDGPA